MMFTGKWNVVTKTPMGEITSVWDARVDGEDLTGLLIDNDGNAELRNGKFVGDTFDFDATIKLPFGEIEFHFSGKVSGDSFEGHSKMAMGQSEVRGTRA